MHKISKILESQKRKIRNIVKSFEYELKNTEHS